MNTERRALVAQVVVALVLPATAAGRRAGRLPRVALVFNTFPLAQMTGAEPAEASARAFVLGLRGQGLADGRDLVVERHSAQGRFERLPTLIQELVGSGVDVIVTGGSALNAAMRATDRVAIVAIVDDPADSGLIASLRRPGGNLTGIGVHSLEGLGKELQLLKQAGPSVGRVAVMDGPVPSAAAALRRRAGLQDPAERLRLQLLWLEVDDPQRLDAVLESIARERVDALVVYQPVVTLPQRRRIADFALRRRLPAIGWPEDGMLMVYAADEPELYRRAAVLVKQILNGAKPGDLPFEEPTRFKLTLNMKAAKALGLAIPNALLLQADEVID